MSDILKDSRFAKYLNDPRYKQIPKHERKIKIDKRFQSMFNDDKFKVKYTVDKRGRPINETSTENLRKYYDLEESENSSSEDDDEKESATGNEKIETPGRFVKRPQSDDEDNGTQLPNFVNDKLTRGKLDQKTKERLLDLDIDYARGEAVLQTDSSSDEESSEAEDDSEYEHEWGELDADAETTEESTRRIAICNMDWDNIKADDLMVLLSSFLPSGGVIHNISIYPSEYGLKRMQEEEVRGPIELTEDKAELSDDGGNEEGSTYHMEKLRRYQLNRLKYYYAVVECDRVATADKLYSECDGMEYESSATKLDMRFIPDDVTFDHEPREVCTKLPDLRKYKPRLFTTTALQQAKVELTWDATNPNRAEAIKSALGGKIDDLDLKEYLASSSDSEDERPTAVGSDSNSDNEGDDPIQKYKSLLEDIEKKDDKKKNRDMEMEITWGLGIKDKAQELVKKKLEEDERPTAVGSDSNSDNEGDDPIQKYKSLLEDIEKKDDKKKNRDMEMEITWGLGIKDKAQELVKKKLEEDNKELTPFEKLLKKRKEKKKLKKLNKNKSQDNEDSDSETNDDIPSDVDMNDPYFAEEFNNPEFKLKKSKNKKLQNAEESNDEDDLKKAELELLLDDEDDGKAHFSLKKIQEAEAGNKKSKRKKKLKQKMMEQKQALPDFEINVNDDRFSALYNSHLYNIDPSDSNYKKTKNMEKLIQEKLKRRPADSIEAPAAKKTKEDAELSLLVKNIKRKSKSVKQK